MVKFALVDFFQEKTIGIVKLRDIDGLPPEMDPDLLNFKEIVTVRWGKHKHPYSARVIQFGDSRAELNAAAKALNKERDSENKTAKPPLPKKDQGRGKRVAKKRIYDSDENEDDKIASFFDPTINFTDSKQESERIEEVVTKLRMARKKVLARLTFLKKYKFKKLEPAYTKAPSMLENSTVRDHTDMLGNTIADNDLNTTSNGFQQNYSINHTEPEYGRGKRIPKRKIWDSDSENDEEAVARKNRNNATHFNTGSPLKPATSLLEKNKISNIRANTLHCHNIEGKHDPSLTNTVNGTAACKTPESSPRSSRTQNITNESSANLLTFPKEKLVLKIKSLEDVNSELRKENEALRISLRLLQSLPETLHRFEKLAESAGALVNNNASDTHQLQISELSEQSQRAKRQKKQTHMREDFLYPLKK